MGSSILMNGLINITDNEFRLISNLIYEKFGINLTEKKRSLLVGRLNNHIKKLGLKNFQEYYDVIINDTTNVSLLSLIDRITTNHSFFYREKDHFECLLNKALPDIIEGIKRKGSKDLRIWCAGCATGEEAYTLSMIINEFFGYKINQWDVGILASDISLTSLEKAQKGIYSIDKLLNLPESYMHRYFDEQDKDNYKVVDELRNIILFKRLNFMNKNFPFKGKFHIIFCRNVMIYFDKVTKDELVKRLYNYIYDGGYLFIGHSESLDRKVFPFEYMHPAVYKKIE